MSKYNYEFKKKIVMSYLNGMGSYKDLAELYKIPSNTCIKEWVCNYNSLGDEGLKRSRKQKKYSFEKKISVIKLYLSSEISYQELAIQEGITNPSMIVNWVNRFRAAAPDALSPQKKGQKKTIDKSKINSKTQKTEERIVDTSAEHVKELEDKAKMRERRSSSTASEENSN